MDAPPTYDDARGSSSNNSSTVADIVPPSTIHVAGRFIHSSDPQAPALYEFSHSIGFLKDADRKVTMRRMEYSVRQKAGGAPTIATRERNLFNLMHRTLGETPTFAFQAEAQGRSASLGSLGMELVRSRSSRLSLPSVGYRVLRTTMGANHRLVGKQMLFQAVKASGSSTEVRWEWSDDHGTLVARELERDGLFSLVVSQEMSVAMRDALTASWIMRLWWEHKDNVSTMSRLINGMRHHGLT
jgi:hypothetical protein